MENNKLIKNKEEIKDFFSTQEKQLYYFESIDRFEENGKYDVIMSFIWSLPNFKELLRNENTKLYNEKLDFYNALNKKNIKNKITQF